MPKQKRPELLTVRAFKAAKKKLRDMNYKKEEMTTPAQRAANPMNLKVGIDTVRNVKKQKGGQLKKIEEEMGW